eukprot:gene2941-8177_t
MATKEDERLIIQSLVSMVVLGNRNPGNIRFAPQGLAFKGEGMKKTESVLKADMLSAETKRVAKGHQLRIKLKSGGQATFEGFKSDEMNQILEFFKTNYGIEIKIVELSLKGHNSGIPKFHDTFLSFDIDGKPAFELPLNVVKSASAQKFEANVDFLVDTEKDDELQQIESMRFVVIPEPGMDDFERTEEFVESIKARASIIETTSKPICSFSTLLFPVPYGRFDVDFFPTFIQLRGLSYNHRIFYENIVDILQLPRVEDGQFIVLSVDPPLRHGQTRHPHILLQFSRDDEGEVEINLDNEDVRHQLSLLFESVAADDATEVTREGQIADIICDLLKGLSRRKIVKPSGFLSSEGFPAVSCSHKADRGVLYFLDHGLIFLHKPIMYIPFSKNLHVEFDRVQESSLRDTKSFDIKLIHQSRPAIEFRGLAQDELRPLLDFFQRKQIMIRKLEEIIRGKTADLADAESDVENGMGLEGSDDDSESDHSFHEGDVEESSMSSGEEAALESDLVADNGIRTKTQKRTRRKQTKTSSSIDDNEGSHDDDDDDDDDNEQFDDGDNDDSGDDDSDASDHSDDTKYGKRSKSSKSGFKSDKSKRSGAKQTPQLAKRVKLPKGPVKARSAYTLWSLSARAELKEQNSELSFGDMNKKLGEKWQSLSSEERKIWEDKAKEDRERYLHEKKQFDEQHPDLENGKKKKGRKKDPNAPKGAKSAYIIFSTGMRNTLKKENPQMTQSELLSECGKLWKELSADEKREYEEAAAIDKTRYENEKMKYLAQHVDAGNDDDDGGGLPSKREKKGKKSLKRGQTKLSFKSPAADGSESD